MSHIVSVHGHSLKLEHSDLGSINIIGGYLQYSSQGGGLNWLHAALPTPNKIDGRNFRLQRVYLRYRLRDINVAVSIGQHVEITAVHVYDAERRIASHDLLAISAISDTWKMKIFAMAGEPIVEHAIGVSIGVQASHFVVEICAVGAEFAPA